MTWRHINFQRQRYDLSHLRDFSFYLIQEASAGKPERQYGIDVMFSWHCFTRTAEEGDSEILMRGREQRSFCHERYSHTHRLPEIIKTLDKRHCRNTGRGNYLTVEFVEDDGTRLEYEVYFTLTKPGKKKNLKLHVESAYIRHKPDVYRDKKKRIRFTILAYNVKQGRKVRP